MLKLTQQVLEEGPDDVKGEPEHQSHDGHESRNGGPLAGEEAVQFLASNEGSMSSGFLGAGMGLGMGVGVGGAVGAGFNDLAHQTVNGAMGQGQPQQSAGTACPSCGHINPAGAKFCQECGTKLETGIRCPSCGHINPAGAKFCQECGARLGGATHCPNCGKELEPGAKFCPECGTKIE